MVKCQSCSSTRIMDFGCKCSDLSSWGMPNSVQAKGMGYVPFDIGIGGGDYVELTYCMDCGKIQAEFPLPESKAERSNE